MKRLRYRRFYKSNRSVSGLKSLDKSANGKRNMLSSQSNKCFWHQSIRMYCYSGTFHLRASSASGDHEKK